MYGRDDHKVDYKTEETIAGIAAGWRSADGTPRDAFIDMRHFFEVTLLNRLKEPYTVEYDERLPPARPAYVTFAPLVLHTRRDSFAKGCSNIPYERYVLAHEAGHMIMHSFYAQAFSNDPSLQINFAEYEYSAEWQANIFADHLLVPTIIVSNHLDAYSLAHACRVDFATAERRIAAARRQWWPIA